LVKELENSSLTYKPAEAREKEEDERNKIEKEKSKNSMLSYIYGGQI